MTLGKVEIRESENRTINKGRELKIRVVENMKSEGQEKVIQNQKIEKMPVPKLENRVTGDRRRVNKIQSR